MELQSDCLRDNDGVHADRTSPALSTSARTAAENNMIELYHTVESPKPNSKTLTSKAKALMVAVADGKYRVQAEC